jgi:ADP-ribosylglycohydrolase
MISVIEKVYYNNQNTEKILKGITSIIKSGKCYFHSFTPDTYYKSMGWYFHSISCCFWFLYRISKGEVLSYFEIIKETINLGGDTDTNAAIVGGVVGVLYGVDSFPSEYLNKLLTFNPLTSNVQRDCIYSPINGVIISKVISEYVQSTNNIKSNEDFGTDMTSSCLSTATLLDFILK